MGGLFSLNTLQPEKGWVKWIPDNRTIFLAISFNDHPSPSTFAEVMVDRRLRVAGRC